MLLCCCVYVIIVLSRWWHDVVMSLHCDDVGVVMVSDDWCCIGIAVLCCCYVAVV